MLHLNTLTVETVDLYIAQGKKCSYIKQVGRQVGIFYQQQIYNNESKNKVCKYFDGWDNAKKAKKLCLHCGPF